ncbi:MAG: hypothetical protein QOH50_4369 [Kribbellaceae bacterium]|nr:hypothetical protein [Kribbellaceae bacterium]
MTPDTHHTAEKRNRFKEIPRLAVETLCAYRRDMSTGDALPAAVRQALTAIDEQDTDAFVAAFAPDGFVDDWGRQFRGPERIRSWSDGELIGVHATFSDVAVSTPGNPVTITAQVGGDGYNGTSHFTFDVQGDRIASMTITA